MISGKDLYNVMTGMVPLYVAMVLGYASVKWWKIFNQDQCSGINKFVALFAVPLLSFHFISSNNPYTMNYKFILADTLQKIITLIVLAILLKFSSKVSIEWFITLFALGTLPNTLVMGIPMLNGMYGENSGSLMVQIVVLQCIIWYTLMLFLFEFRGAKILIAGHFPDNAGSIKTIKVDVDVVSLDGTEPLETRVEVMEDGKLNVRVSRSSSSSFSRIPYFNDVEIYSLPSSRFGQEDVINYFVNEREFGSRRARALLNGEASTRVYPRPPHKAEISPSKMGSEMVDDGESVKDTPPRVVRSSSAPAIARGIPSKFKGAIHEGGLDYAHDFSALTYPKVIGAGNGTIEHELPSIDEQLPEAEAKREPKPTASAPAAGVMTRLIFIMVWRKLIRNPNTYSSLIGLIWSLVSFRWRVQMPVIISASIKILSDTGLGMAMFSLGLFMALQPKIIACGKAKAGLAAAVRFLVGPAVMALCSAVVGIRGDLLRISIVQAALPEGIVPFVFAKEYNVHPDILSTSVMFGMLVAVPITLVYYMVLGLVHLH